MTKINSLKIPLAVETALVQIGKSVRVARLRRRQSAADLASRMHVSLPTLRRLERGDSGVSLGAYLTAMWIFGLLDQISDAASPGADRLAAALEAARLPKRAPRGSHEKDDEFDH
jgi:hypothetical protein